MRTFALLKPEIVTYPSLCWQVLEKTLTAGLEVTRARKTTLTLAEAGKLYAAHKDKFFYERLIRHITSGPVIALELQTGDSTGGDPVARWRQLLGPTKVYRTAYESPNSLRGAFGLTDTRNVGHGSDSPQSVADESALFFDTLTPTNDDACRPSKSDLFQLIFGDLHQQ
uniref:Nucleoside diphosphate kinase n=1 Tax=Plectus sambesii TaxID=2011161 RepID=A0A914VRF4_9BILA